MLTAAGCRARRQRLLDMLAPSEPLVLADPLNLLYFANFHVEAISQHADFGGVLVIRPDGSTLLVHDSKLPRTIDQAHVDERKPVTWYTGQEPGAGPRRMLLRPTVESLGGRLHDSLMDPLAPRLAAAVAESRRRKDLDEIALLETCMRATLTGHDWARRHIREGMTELDVYLGVSAACQKQLGHWAVVYGDFAVSSGKRRGGPPTERVLRNGETFILDYSVIVQGYRSDYTNTLVVGGQPTDEQKRLFGLCVMALEAGERELKPGVACQHVYDAINGVFEAAGVANLFPSHAGHGLGISHPEAPYIVRHSSETLVAGDVVTLEPGLYVNDIGIRVEHNYVITDTGCTRLSHHTISLT
jgi:Xaa-Pro aminopeptidase